MEQTIINEILYSEVNEQTASLEGRNVLRLLRKFQEAITDSDYRNLNKTVQILQQLCECPTSIMLLVNSNIFNQGEQQQLLIKMAEKGAKDVLNAISKVIESTDTALAQKINQYLHKRSKKKDAIAFDTKELTKEVFDKANSIVCDQEMTVNHMLLNLYEYSVNGCNSMLPYVNFILGPSGCGKTFLSQELAKLLHLPYLLLSVAGVTENGFKGNSTEDLINKIKHFALKTNGKKAVIVLDEFDKLTKPNYDSEGANISETVQDQIMELFSPGIPLSSTLNTSQYFFILTGAYSELRKEKYTKSNTTIGFVTRSANNTKANSTHNTLTVDDLKQYGVTDELSRRISNIYQVNSLTPKSVLKIALQNDSVFIKKLQNTEKAYNISIDSKMIKDAVDLAFQENFEQQSQGMITRAYSIFEDTLNTLILKEVFDIGYNAEKKEDSTYEK